MDFIGRNALEQQKKEGVKKLFVYFTLEDHDAEVDYWPHGREPIFRGGKYVGFTTTTAFGYTLQKMVLHAFSLLKASYISISLAFIYFKRKYFIIVECY